MGSHVSSPWVRSELVSYEGEAEVSLDGDTTETGRVTLTPQKLVFRPTEECSCAPDVEVPLDVITQAQLVGLRRRLEVHVGGSHRLVLKGAEVGRLHGRLSDLLGAAALQ